MSTKSTLAVALAAGFLGGALSRYLVPPTIYAQAQAPPLKEIRAQQYILENDAGVPKGIFGFDNGIPAIEVIDSNGRVWSAEWLKVHGLMILRV